MVTRKNILLYIIILLFCLGCINNIVISKGTFQQECEKEMFSKDVFSIIDTSKLYQSIPIENYLDRKTNSFLQFTKEGNIVYFSRTNYNDKIVRVSSKYKKGKYYLDEKGCFIIKEYFTHPQGGGWIKEILIKENNGDSLIFRSEKSNQPFIKLVPYN